MIPLFTTEREQRDYLTANVHELTTMEIESCLKTLYVGNESKNEELIQTLEDELLERHPGRPLPYNRHLHYKRQGLPGRGGEIDGSRSDGLH